MAEQQPTGQVSITGTLLSYLTSITTWSRAGIAVVLGLTSLFGVMVYQNPQTIFEMINGFLHQREQSQHPFLSPLTTDVQRDIKAAFPQFAPHIVGLTVWRVSLDTNQVQLVAWAINPQHQGTFGQVYQER